MTRQPPTNVYVIGSPEGPQKIGISNNPDNRIVTLQNETRTKLQLITSFYRPSGDAKLIERVAHQLLKEKRATGEWFNVTIQEAVDTLQAAIATVDGDGVEAPGGGVHQQGRASFSNPLFAARIAPELAAWIKIEAAEHGRLAARELEMMLRELQDRRARDPMRRRRGMQ